MAEFPENEGGYSPQNILDMIQKTKNKFGEIENIILCDIKDGEKGYCINGRHRLLINPNWKKVHLGELTLPEALNLRAIITLVKQPDSEKNRDCIIEYCEYLKEQNCPSGQYVKKIFEGLDGAISKKTISKYVPDEFKIVTKPRGTIQLPSDEDELLCENEDSKEEEFDLDSPPTQDELDYGEGYNDEEEQRKMVERIKQVEKEKQDRKQKFSEVEKPVKEGTKADLTGKICEYLEKYGVSDEEIEKSAVFGSYYGRREYNLIQLRKGDLTAILNGLQLLNEKLAEKED